MMQPHFPKVQVSGDAGELLLCLNYIENNVAEAAGLLQRGGQGPAAERLIAHNKTLINQGTQVYLDGEHGDPAVRGGHRHSLRISAEFAVVFVKGLFADIAGDSCDPGWKRLTLNCGEGGGGDTATLDGETYALEGANDRRFLEILQQAKGAHVKGLTIERAIDTRPDRVLKKLPQPIQSIIKAPGQGGRGYLMQ